MIAFIPKFDKIRFQTIRKSAFKQFNKKITLKIGAAKYIQTLLKQEGTTAESEDGTVDFPEFLALIGKVINLFYISHKKSIFLSLREFKKNSSQHIHL